MSNVDTYTYITLNIFEYIQTAPILPIANIYIYTYGIYNYIYIHMNTCIIQKQQCKHIHINGKYRDTEYQYDIECFFPHSFFRWTCNWINASLVSTPWRNWGAQFIRFTPGEDPGTSSSIIFRRAVKLWGRHFLYFFWCSISIFERI